MDDLNTRLIDYFGVDTITGRPIFRIVWSDDQIEKKLMDRTEGGIHLLFPEAIIVKKYPYIKSRYVLERLVVVPEVNLKEMLDLKLSYEPIWTYQNTRGEYVEPIWEATKFVVDTLYAALGKASMRKYVDSEENTTQEGYESRINKLQAELFGNETDVTDALAYSEGVVVPHNYKKEN